MKNHDELIIELQESLNKAANVKTRKWWGNYLKGKAVFRGVGIPVIRAILSNWIQENALYKESPENQFELALFLFRSEFTEDKLAGTLYIQDYLREKFQYRIMLSEFIKLYDEDLIRDWNVCDWFCIRVLGPLIKKNGMPCAKQISKWRDAKHLWLARSSVVAFVPVSMNLDYIPLMSQNCSALIKRPERFAKTCVGWLMREIAAYDVALVLDFIDSNLKYFTLEVLRNALKHSDKKIRDEYVQKLKQYD